MFGMTAEQTKVMVLEDEYDAFALIPDHRWGREQSEQFEAIVSQLREAYDAAGTDEDDRIAL